MLPRSCRTHRAHRRLQGAPCRCWQGPARSQALPPVTQNAIAWMLKAATTLFQAVTVSPKIYGERSFASGNRQKESSSTVHI
eukprot:358375-Chlamydomonas_euryale.AAC.6